MKHSGPFPQESYVSQASSPPDILSPAFAADPYGAYRTMRESAPLIHHEATGSYLVSRYEDVERIFKDGAQEFTTENYDWQLEPVHGRTILQLSGREHAVRRALVAPAFRGADLQEKFLPVIERNARELIDAFRHTGEADLVEALRDPFPRAGDRRHAGPGPGGPPALPRLVHQRHRLPRQPRG